MIESNFSAAAKGYRQSAKIQEEIGQRLLARFDYYKIEPQWILDLGAGPGVFSHQLKKRYRKSRVVAFDLSLNMLKQIKRQWRLPLHKVSGCMSALPFKNAQFDVIFANQVIHWAEDYLLLFKELRRILKVGGVFVFSTLGPDTFQELRQAWQEIDNNNHVRDFSDMHLMGDCLMKSGLKEPVVDMEYITLRYKSVDRLARDLKAQGVQYQGKNARKGLTTPSIWNRLKANYETFRDHEGWLPLTYEVVYGQAWRGEPEQRSKVTAPSEHVVPISSLKSAKNAIK